MKALSSVCASEFSKVVRCAGGGRDHLPCCARRGVPAQCQPLCQSVHQQSTGADYQQCLPNIGQIILCYEEGTITLPSPVKNLKAVSISDNSVIMTWQPGEEEEEDKDPARVFTPTVHFEIYYKKIGVNNTGSAVFESQQVGDTVILRWHILYNYFICLSYIQIQHSLCLLRPLGLLHWE